MKPRRLLFALLLLLAACRPAAAGSDLPPLKTAIAQTVVVEMTAANLPAPLPTATFTPTPLPTATPRPTATPTPGPTPTPTPGPRACAPGQLNAVYVTDITIPDYYDRLQPGQPFTKTWAVRNTGQCTWTPDFHLYFHSGREMQGQPVPLGRPVAPGEEVYVSVQLQAPERSGVYSGAWQLGAPDGERFGELLTIIIVIP